MYREGNERFLNRPLFPQRSGDRAERPIALVRMALATVSLVAVYLDPTTPAQYVTLTYGLLAGYALYSAVLLVLLSTTTPSPSRRLALCIHAVDIGAAALLTLFTDGPGSPFFVLFGFALLAAGYRWGFWETLYTGIASGILFGLEAVLTSDWFWQGGVAADAFELNRFLLRCTYLVLLAIMVGFIAEHEKAARDEANAHGSATERARVARELHDGVIQSLIGLKMQVELLRTRESDDSAGAAALEQMDTSLRREIDNLRTLMFELTPVEQEQPELAALLADLVERFEHASGISTRFVSTADGVKASPHARREITRIAQEALINVRRHSGARNVLLSLSNEDGCWRLVVDDDGRGFEFEGRWPLDALERERRGPRVIKERVRLLRGLLVIDSRPRSGARLEISVPSPRASWEG